MTQTELVLRHLKKHGSLSSLEAMKEYGIMRLGARIWDLRDAGWDIETQNEKSINRYGVKVSYANYVLRGGDNESVQN